MKRKVRSESNKSTPTGTKLSKKPGAGLKVIVLAALTVLTGVALAVFGPMSSAQRRVVPPKPTPVPQFAPQPLSDTVMAQIAALNDEKESRTPAQQKIDSQLIYATKMFRGQSIAAGVDTLEVNVGAEPDGTVTVDISAVIDDNLLATLKNMDVTYSNVFPQYHALRAVANLNQLEDIASLAQVRFISPKQEAMTNQATDVTPDMTPRANPMTFPGPDERAEIIRQNLAASGIGTGGQTNVIPNGYTGVGSVTAEAVISHGVYSARGTFNTDGTGIRIGVLSDGVTNLATSQGTGDLPPTCSSLAPPATEKCINVATGQAGSGDEGTAMLEVVHDIAPGAQLYFATAFTSIGSFAQNIRDLRNIYHCDIIVDDVGYFVESPFQDGQGPLVVSPTNGGVVTQAVNDVTALGALYFSSAANSGNLTDATSGTWEGDFVDGGAAGAPLPAGNVHNFGGQNFDLLTVSGGTAPINLIWSDPLGSSANDYDLFRLNAAGTVIQTASTNIQNGTQDPIEQISQSLANPRLVILKKTGAANRFLHLDTNRGVLSISTQGNTHGHNAGSGAFGVAAVPVFSPFNFPVGGVFFNGPFPNLFSGTAKTETFSSDGPRRVFYQGDGTPITPGNVSSTGGTLLQQPLIAASDGNSVTGVGGFGSPFFGTSCAAPSAAAIAGLVKGANPALTSAQIKTALLNTAIDIEAAGIDRDTGSGIVMPYAAMQSLGLPAQAFVEFNGYTMTEFCGNGDGLIEPGESANVTVNLKNTGLVNATTVSSVLNTLTPATHVLAGVSPYSNLAASGGSGNNTVSFRVGVHPTVPFDQVVNLSQTINYAGGWTTPQLINFSVQTGRQPIATTLDATPPATSTSFPVTSTTSQTTRLFRADPASTCATPHAFPGTSGAGARNLDSYTLTNPTAAPVCVSVTLTPGSASTDFIQAVAYLGSFNPANVATNYLADIGASPSPGVPKTMSFTLAAGATAVVVVNETTGTGTGTGTPYTLQVSGLPLIAAPVSGCLTTAAPVSISGRVQTAAGRSISNAIVTLTDTNGGSRSYRTGPFGFYSFTNIQPGQAYVLSVSARLYTFAPRVVNISDNLTGLDLTAEP